MKAVNLDWMHSTWEDYESVSGHGVYVIWSDGGHSLVPYAVYVGQGDVADRIANHVKDPKIRKHTKDGDLLIAWASVPEYYRDGIERYLADRHSPVEGDRHPEAQPIRVNDY